MPHTITPGRSPSSRHAPEMLKQEQQESPSMRGKKVMMTKEQFRQWLENIDSNRDGHISKEELRAALKGLGMNFTSWKSWRAMVHADLNRSNSVEGDDEIEELIKYAAKRWGIIVTQVFG